MQNEVKVGDLVIWTDAPNGALVRQDSDFYLRINDHGWCVCNGYRWAAFACYADGAISQPWPWYGAGQVTIIALGITGSETAADLQRLAEIFEVREQLLDPGIAGFTKTSADEMEYWARRLYDAGLRHGMAAEDAARLLAEDVR